jgi:hypothetical protein
MKQIYATVKPRSARGKSLINNLGDTFEVSLRSERVMFTDLRGPWVCLEKDGFWEWFRLNDDSTLEIKVLGELSDIPVTAPIGGWGTVWND